MTTILVINKIISDASTFMRQHTETEIFSIKYKEKAL